MSAISLPANLLGCSKPKAGAFEAKRTQSCREAVGLFFVSRVSFHVLRAKRPCLLLPRMQPRRLLLVQRRRSLLPGSSPGQGMMVPRPSRRMAIHCFSRAARVIGRSSLSRIRPGANGRHRWSRRFPVSGPNPLPQCPRMAHIRLPDASPCSGRPGIRTLACGQSASRMGNARSASGYGQHQQLRVEAEYRCRRHTLFHQHRQGRQQASFLRKI